MTRTRTRKMLQQYDQSGCKNICSLFREGGKYAINVLARRKEPGADCTRSARWREACRCCAAPAAAPAQCPAGAGPGGGRRTHGGQTAANDPEHQIRLAAGLCPSDVKTDVGHMNATANNLLNEEDQHKFTQHLAQEHR